MSQRERRNAAMTIAQDHDLDPSMPPSIFPPELTRRYTLVFKPRTASRASSSSNLKPLAVRNVSLSRALRPVFLTLSPLCRLMLIPVTDVVAKSFSQSLPSSLPQWWSARPRSAWTIIPRASCSFLPERLNFSPFRKSRSRRWLIKYPSGTYLAPLVFIAMAP